MIKIILIISLLLMVGCSSEQPDIVIPQTQAEPEVEHIRTVKVGSIYPSYSPVGVFLESFAMELEEIFDGEVKVIVYHDGFLGDNERHKELLDNGGLDYAVIRLDEEDPLFEFMGTPYLFNDESIFEAVEILNENDPAENLHRTLLYINCGSVGAASNERVEVMREIPVASEEEPQLSYPFSLVNEYLTEENYRYFIDIDYSYDIGLFSESNEASIMFSEHQDVMQAVIVAKESLDISYQIEPETEALVYKPENYEQFIQSISNPYITFQEEDEYLEIITMFEEILPPLLPEDSQEQD